MLESHTRSCPFRKARCNLCSWEGLPNLLERHCNNDCPQRPHSCPHCGARDTYAAITGRHVQVCPQRPHSCPHCGTRDTYAAITGHHVQVCPQRPHSCPHCGTRDTYAAITGRHVQVCPQRPHSCPHCGSRDTYAAITGRHVQVCPQRPHSCPHCGTRDTYAAITGRHVQVCPQWPHTCQYCAKKGTYVDIAGHLKVCPQRPHTCQHCGTRGPYAEITGPHDEVCPRKPVSCDKCDWEGIRSTLDHHRNNDCPQRPFKCRYCGEGGTYVAITGPHDEVCKKKPVPCPHSECDSRIQRVGIKRHLENCAYEEIPCKYAKLGCGTKVKREDAPRHEADAINHHELALQTTLRLKDIVEKLNITCSPVTFALSGYVRRTQDRVVITPSFYTSRRGYNMAVEIHTKNGEIEAFVQMKPGSHDSKLRWPFMGKVTIELLNQLEDQNHVKLKESTERINRGGQTRLLINYCLPQDVINTCLKDDTLFFRVTVEAFSHKSWLECTENNGNGQ